MITLIDNVLQTIVTIVAATICTTEYVRTRHRSHLYMAMTLWFYVLGIYYWTVYLVVMGNLPDTILFADLAFIASFVFLLPIAYSAPIPCAIDKESPVMGFSSRGASL